jgi:hypothetical protein
MKDETQDGRALRYLLNRFINKKDFPLNDLQNFWFDLVLRVLHKTKFLPVNITLLVSLINSFI